MEGNQEKPKRQLNIRLSDIAFERLRAWAFLEDGQQPGPFVTSLIEEKIEAVAAEDPVIDDMVRISAERQSQRDAKATPRQQ